MSDDTMTLEDVLTETGILPKWLEQGREEGREEGEEERALKVARNLLKKGWTPEETAETVELDIAKIRTLTAGLN
jgi:predicted transposase/invertase (TIGR01784 family)